MKKLADYIAESEFPVAGDRFAINIREECLIESHVVDVVEDGIVIEGDERLLALLEEYGFQLETIRRYGAVGSSAGMGYTMGEAGEPDMPSRRGFLKGLASFAASAAVPSSVVKMLSTPAGVGTLGISAGLALLKGIRDHLDQYTAEDDDDYFEAYEDMAAELGFESTNDKGEYHDPVGNLLNLYRKNPEEAAQQLIKHIQSKAVNPADVKSSFTSRANDPSDWRYQARKDRELDSSEADLEKLTTKSAASTPGGISSLARAAGVQIGRTMSNIGRGTADTVLNQPARDMGRIEPTTAPAALPAPTTSPGMQIPKQKLKVPNEQDKELALIRRRAGLDETAPDQSETNAARNDPLADKAADLAPVGADSSAGRTATIDEDGVDPVNAAGKDAEKLQGNMTAEAKYQGREVKLGKKMAGDVKKSKVYVRGPKGNVVKVNFGDPNMTIKKSNPARRKSFRARHNCDNPGPRWKARYWSCRSW
jgi:hypothetical protein